MAKPMLITFPFLMLLIDFWPLDATYRTLFSLTAEKSPLFVLAAASGARDLPRPGRGRRRRTPPACAVDERPRFLCDLPRKALVPWPLAVYYPHPRRRGGRLLALAAAALTLASIACVRFRRGRPWLPVGWLWFLGTLVPVIGLVQVGGQAMADRYTYVPLIGIFILCAWGGAELAQSRPALRLALGGVGAAIVISFAWVARNQVAVWRTTETLFSHALRVAKESWMAHDVLGRALQREGRTAEAISHFEAALRIEPDSAVTSNRLGVVNSELGRFENAVRWFERAVAVEPRYAPARFNLGMAYHRLGRREAAFEEYRRLVALGEPRAADLLARISR